MVHVLLLVHAFVTLFLCGLIWFVQVVHYPLFARVGRDGFKSFQLEHERRTTWVVAPVMIVELLTSVLLVGLRPEGVPRMLTLVGAFLVFLIWLSTFVLQVPRHRVLEHGFDVRAHRGLVRTNWLRTIAWTARATIATYLLA